MFRNLIASLAVALFSLNAFAVWLRKKLEIRW